MSDMLSIKIDVTKISRERLYKGTKGTYLDAIAIPTPTSEYGDCMICESVSKEERAKNVRGTIIGNIKIIRSRKTDAQKLAHGAGLSEAPPESDDVPF